MKKLDVYQEYVRLHNEVQAKKEELQALETALESLKQELIAKIPVDVTVHGIMHKVSVRRSTSYQSALKAVTEHLVPKSKRNDVQDIIAEYTTENEIHTLKLIDEV